MLPSNQIAIVDSGNHCICIFDGESGSFVRAFGSQGETEDGQFSSPCAIAADAYGHLLVLDSYTDRLQVFDTDGTHLCTKSYIAGLTNEYDRFKGLEWWAEGGTGRLTITHRDKHKVVVFNWEE